MRDLQADREICEKATPGPVKWQRFGKQFHLTGQYGLRPIIFSTVEVEKEGYVPETHISNRDAKRDLLIPLDPNHPDSKFIEEAWAGWPEAIDRAIVAEDRLQQAEAQLEKERNYFVAKQTEYADMLRKISERKVEAEADNAALRMVLLQWQKFGWLKPRDENFIRINMGNTKKALESDSGAALLKELEGLRELKELVIGLIEWEDTPCPFCEGDSGDSRKCTCFEDREIWDRIEQIALPEVEKEEI